MRIPLQVRINGVEEKQEIDAGQTLLSFLREKLDLTGAKEGCNEGECGACVVLLDGKAVNSCLVLAAEADGCEIMTIEGIGDGRTPHPVQRAFLDNQAVQCGFCTPGMILSTLALLAENPDPSEDDIRMALAGNLCRCTGYRQILDAVLDAAAALRDGDR